MADQTPLFAKLFSWLPAWAGFVVIILISIGAIIGGALVPEPCLIAFGAWGVISSILAWVTGATSRVGNTSVDPTTFGGCVSNIRPWAFIVILVLFLGMAAVCIFV